jgi:glycosyltransferase involved in cell wall biosynthesis
VQEPKALIWDSIGLQSLHSGVGHHAYSLNEALGRRGIVPQVLPSHPCIDSVWRTQLASSVPSVQQKWQRLKPYALWTAGRQLRSWLSSRSGGRACVVHGLSNYNIPRYYRSDGIRTVLTVHDLIPLLEPRAVSSYLAAFLRWQMPRALERADAIITVSAWTRSTLEELFPQARGKIVTIPNGCQRSFPPVLANPLPQRLLTIARGEAYKQLELIPRILEQLPPQFHWDLVTDAHGIDRLHRSAGSLQHRLRILKGLSQIELDRVEEEAGIYVHPSRWEGYCLPAASALARGRPVVYVKGSGIDEVVDSGGFGLEREAGPELWVRAIEELSAQYELWSSRARAHAQHFLSWEEVANQTLAVYDILT